MSSFFPSDAHPMLKRLIVLFDRFGQSDYIGEPVSQLQHAVQAAQAATLRFGVDTMEGKEAVVAALLHDVGHLVGIEAGEENRMDGCGIMNHEQLGGEFLSSLGFSSRVCKLVSNHVMAKRYLCWKDTEYHSRLSDASKTTLTFQGGPLSTEEAQIFEADSDFATILALRLCDEAAKVPGVDVPDLLQYKEILLSVCVAPPSTTTCQYQLSAAQIQFFHENSYLKIQNLLPYYSMSADDVSTWIDDISTWEPSTDKWIIQYEASKESLGKQLCRAENFVDFHENMNLLSRKVVQDVVSGLFHEPAVLFKEKINFKLPGGGGFLAHQDSVAYMGLAQDHISVMVAVDAANQENGCLFLAPGKWKSGQVPLTEAGTVDPSAEGTMTFIPITCNPGDVLFFSGYIPHRSGKNESVKPRRAMFLTYNPLSQGDHHKCYYDAKHSGLHGFNTGATISFIQDFTGSIVS
jgi:predicted HD phosphohydrolase